MREPLVDDVAFPEDGTPAAAGGLVARRVRFEYGDDFDPAWHPRLPEFAAVANAVSLQMPTIEPYVALAVRSRLDELDDEVERAEAAGYVAQELEHHRQHRALNDRLAIEVPAVARVERWLAALMGRFSDRRDTDFGLAFAAAFEAMAYAGARWVDERLHRLLDGADPVAATLFVWHLAEEVEHKSVADDVARSVGVGRRARIGGGLLAFVVLAVFTILGLLPQLWSSRRLFHPVAIGRLVVWAISFVFVLLPALTFSILEVQRPADLVDPGWMARWLRGYDPASRTIPLWNELG